MYLHLGQGVVVPYRDVLALFDLDNTSASHLTRRFLERAEQAGQVVNVAEDLPKSFVLCRPAGGEATVYLSQLSTATLLRRAENNSFDKQPKRAAGGGSCGGAAGAAPGRPDIPMEVFKCLKNSRQHYPGGARVRRL